MKASHVHDPGTDPLNEFNTDKLCWRVLSVLTTQSTFSEKEILDTFADYVRKTQLLKFKYHHPK